MDATAVGTAVCVGTGFEVGVTAVGTAACVAGGVEVDTTAVGTAVCVGTGFEVGVTAVGTAACVAGGVEVDATAVGTAVCVGTGLEVGVTAVGTPAYVGTGVGIDAAPVTASVCCCGPRCSSPHAAKTNPTIAAAANSMEGRSVTLDFIVQANTYPSFCKPVSDQWVRLPTHPPPMIGLSGDKEQEAPSQGSKVLRSISAGDCQAKTPHPNPPRPRE